MPGYTEGQTGENALFSDLYWIDEKIKLRELKEVIGSKLIWKYRLRFYTSLEAFIESQNKQKKDSEFTAEEKEFLREIHASVYR
jgi:hypothetical protein